MPETALEKLERQYEQAKARLQAAKARDAEKHRKLDARRKIVLGGALMERATRDPEAAKMLAVLIKGMSRKQDQKTFAGWSSPSAVQQADISTGGMKENTPPRPQNAPQSAKAGFSAENPPKIRLGHRRAENEPPAPKVRQPARIPQKRISAGTGKQWRKCRRCLHCDTG